MGRGITEITMAQLEGVVGTYSNVIWMNDPSDTDLVKTIVGQPRTIIINLGQLLNIASGDIQGDAIAIDELEASEIADDAVRGRELAETPSLFQTATEVTHDHDTGTGAVLLAANAAGGGDRLVLCQVEVTETFATTSWEIDVGSTSSSNGLFDDIFAGLATLQINETLVGAYLLPEGEALTVTETSMVGDTAGQLTFRLIVSAPAAGSIPGALLANDAVSFPYGITPTAVDHAAGSPVDLLAADPTNDRLCLVTAIATETAAGGPDFDVGSEITATDSVFNDLSGGTWVVGERWTGACVLPAGEKLQCTIAAAGTAGAISFYVTPLTVVEAGTKNLFETVTSSVTHDHDTAAPATLLAANAAGEGDRLVICQAEITEAFVTTSWEIDVGSTSSSNGLFDDIFGGDATVGIGESVVGVYLLPEAEALTLTETDMTGDSAGQITFRLNVVTLGAGSIPGNLLADDGVYFPYGVTPTLVAHDAGGTTQLLAPDANNDRVVLVTAVASETAAGGPDFDVGAGAGSEVFNDLAAGVWAAGERWQGAMVLAAGATLNCTNIAGASTAGEINFYVIALTTLVQTAQIADAAITGIKLGRTPNAFQDPATEVTHDHDEAGGSATLLAANAAGGGDRLVVVQCEVTEAFADVTDMDIDVGPAGTPAGLFHDLFAGALNIGLGETLVGICLLPEGEALITTENAMTGDTAGQFTFRTYVYAPAAGSIPGALLADDAIGLFEDITPTTVAFGGAATQQLLASDANSNRHVLVMAIAGVAANGCDWDVGVAAGNEVFDDISGGTWIAGERWMGACDLPAGSALNVTLQTAGSAGSIDFYVIPLTPLAATANIEDAAVTGLKLASVGSLFDGASGAVTVIERDYADGTPQQLLAANAATAGDRLILVQAHVTEAFVLTSFDWDVGSTTDPNGLFDDLFAGDATIGLRESEMSAYILPAGEALQLLEIEQTDGGAPAGKVTFRILDMGAITNARIANSTIADNKLSSYIVKEPGRIACGRADFAGVATPAITVTIGAVVYQEADTEDFPNGVWTNGATANDSAVSLAAAINGDTRNAGAGTYAAVVLTDTVFIFSLAVGTAGNVAIVVSAGEPAVVENLIGGAAAAVKQAVTIMHTVTAAEVAVAAGAPEVLIPLPFDPSYFSWQVYDSTGGIYAVEITARGTVTNAAGVVPAYFRLANNGVTDVQAGDIVRLVAVE